VRLVYHGFFIPFHAHYMRRSGPPTAALLTAEALRRGGAEEEISKRQRAKGKRQMTNKKNLCASAPLRLRGESAAAGGAILHP